MNATEAVRNYAATNGTITKKSARNALGLSVEQTAYAFDTLKKQGFLIRVKHGVYQFTEFVERPGSEVNDKIWSAMKVSSKAFTASDIAKLADSTTSYVYKRFRMFKAEGYIKQCGRKITGLRASKKLFRLTLKGKDKAHAPNVEAFKPDPLVMAAVNLNRLICSGVAMRDHDAGQQALKFCEEIRKGLEDAATS